MIRRILPLIMLVFMVNTFATAQSFEEYAKQRDAQFADYAKRQDEALKKYADDMDKRLQALDKEWTDYLKKKFAEFETVVKKKPELGPKPKATPVINADVKKEAPKKADEARGDDNKK